MFSSRQPLRFCSQEQDLVQPAPVRSLVTPARRVITANIAPKKAALAEYVPAAITSANELPFIVNAANLSHVTDTGFAMRRSLIVVVVGLLMLAASVYAGRPYYGGGKHTTSHGGTYPSGVGSSHKGGHYVNPNTGNHYGRHK